MRNTVYILFISLFFLLSCNDDNPDNPAPDGKLEKIADYSINVKETSGLSFGPDKKTLLTVSDNTGQIYELDLQGNVLRTLAYKGDDLEGVAYNNENNEIAVVEERKRQVVIVDYDNGNELRRYDIDVEANESNKGLEGISWNGNNNCYYIVNEDKPSVLLVWKEDEGIISRINLNLGSDNSGIYVDENNSTLWILSDESEALYKCNYNAEKEKFYDVDINKPEGIVVDSNNNRVYIVRDQFSKLFVFQFMN